jgi:hypothetical protein
MLTAYIGVGVAGFIVWLLLKRAETAADGRSGTLFAVGKIALVVLVFLVEFFLQDVLPQVGKDAIQREYGPPPYVPYESDP